jgi:hypothetical protein
LHGAERVASDFLGVATLIYEKTVTPLLYDDGYDDDDDNHVEKISDNRVSEGEHSNKLRDDDDMTMNYISGELGTDDTEYSGVHPPVEPQLQAPGVDSEETNTDKDASPAQTLRRRYSDLSPPPGTQIEPSPAAAVVSTVEPKATITQQRGFLPPSDNVKNVALSLRIFFSSGTEKK